MGEIAVVVALILVAVSLVVWQAHIDARGVMFFGRNNGGTSR